MMGNATGSYPTALQMPATLAESLLSGRVSSIAAQYRQPVDYPAILGDHRALYCGEDHWDLNAKADLTIALPALKRHGVTHLGMEMFFADSKGQAALDHYFAERDFASLRAIRERLYNFGVQYACAPAYERLVMAAFAHGIRVVGIDAHPSHRGLANAAWADVIGHLLEESAQARVIVYGGHLHLGHQILQYSHRPFPSVNQELAARGYTGPVVHYGSNGLDSGNHRINNRDAQVYAAIASVGGASEHFLVAPEPPTSELQAALLAGDEDIPWPDFLIHPIQRIPADEAQLGLPDDAYWDQRWRTFHTHSWEHYVTGDDPTTFVISP